MNWWEGFRAADDRGVGFVDGVGVEWDDGVLWSAFEF
jgi:hypothetical protein